MAYLQVDEQKCIRCDQCVEVCSSRIISRSGENVPSVHSSAVALCIGCGQCVAVCPKGALRLEIQSEEPFVDVPESPNFDPAAVELFLRGRRSVRAFKKTPVPRELLESLVRTTAYAPTAVNRQPVQWVLVYEEQTMQELKELTIAWMRANIGGAERYRGFLKRWDKGEDAILRDAPHLAIAWSEKDASLWAAIDSSIALTYFEVAARLQNLGTCWAGMFVRAAQYSPDIVKRLGLPADAIISGAQMVGFPEIRFPRLPWRKPVPLQWI